MDRLGPYVLGREHESNLGSLAESAPWRGTNSTHISTGLIFCKEASLDRHTMRNDQKHLVGLFGWIEDDQPVPVPLMGVTVDVSAISSGFGKAIHVLT